MKDDAICPVLTISSCECVQKIQLGVVECELNTMVFADSIPVRALSVCCSLEIDSVLSVLKFEPFIFTAGSVSYVKN